MDVTLSIVISLICLALSTTLGSAFVFFFKGTLSDRVNNIILGFAGGVMIAASFFGLLMPSIEESQATYEGWLSVLPPLIGFVLGALLLFILDRVTPHFHQSTGEDEGPRNAKISHNLRFFLAVTLHNIPEGLSVGFALGLALNSSQNQPALASAALALAIGISLQNIPEGAAVSIPLYSEGMSRGKSFGFGAASGIVEPIFAAVGLALSQLSVLNPWLLSIAAGAMIYVTLDEILPEARKGGFSHYGIWAFVVGFAIMMTLEIVL